MDLNGYDYQLFELSKTIRFQHKNTLTLINGMIELLKRNLPEKVQNAKLFWLNENFVKYLSPYIIIGYENVEIEQV